MREPTEIQDSAGTSGKKGALLAAIVLVAVLALAFVAYRALSQQAAIASQEPIASQAADRGPELADYDATVYDEYGDARTLTGIADGKPFVMNFWATWCPYCVEEMSDYQDIVNEYSDRVSFAFIDIADGQRETVADASAWLYEHEYSLPAYYDTTLAAMYAFGATSLPTTVVVATDGEIMDISKGAIDPDLMRSALDSLLAV